MYFFLLLSANRQAAQCNQLIKNIFNLCASGGRAGCCAVEEEKVFKSSNINPYSLWQTLENVKIVRPNLNKNSVISLIQNFLLKLLQIFSAIISRWNTPMSYFLTNLAEKYFLTAKNKEVVWIFGRKWEVMQIFSTLLPLLEVIWIFRTYFLFLWPQKSSLWVSPSSWKWGRFKVRKATRCIGNNLDIRSTIENYAAEEWYTL